MMTENYHPEETWTLDQLGEFCSKRHQRMAADAWEIGKAMCLAKKLCKEQKASFTEWKKKHEFSSPTASRYMRLHLAYPGETDKARLIEIGIMDALVEAGISKEVEEDVDERPDLTKGIQGSSPIRPSTFRIRQRPITSAEPPSAKPSWAVEDEEEIESPPEDAEVLAEVWSIGQSLEEECRSAVPWQVRTLKEKTEMLLEHDANVLLRAWPEENEIREHISQDIDALLVLLPRLASTMSHSDELAQVI